MTSYNTTWKEYRTAIKSMDRQQLLDEFTRVLDRVEQGKVANWPDGSERREEYRYSVGPAVEPVNPKRDVEYYDDGSVKSFRNDQRTVKFAKGERLSVE
jgi:hypothetical protein